MQTKALIFYRGALAHYAINREEDNTYQAYLIRYDGKLENAPVTTISFNAGKAIDPESEDGDLISRLAHVANQKLGLAASHS